MYQTTPDSNRAPQKRTWIELSFRLLQFGILAHILLFPLGQALREISSVLAMTGVFVYYLGAYTSSNLKRYPHTFFFIFFYAILIFKTFHSINVSVSLKALDHLSYDSLLLFFPALEFVKKKKHLDWFILAIVLLCFYVGLDAVYQYVRGEDFFFQNLLVGKKTMLTATRDDPLFGNLLAIFLPITFSMVFILQTRWSFFKALLGYSLLTTPAFFFLFFSLRRTGYFAFGSALWLYCLIKKKYLQACGLFFVFIILLANGPSRFLLQKILDHGRWELWKTALSIWKENMFLGNGLDTFKYAQILYHKEIFFRAGVYKAYPHSLIFSLLVDTGLLGFTAYLLVFFLSLGFIYRSALTIRTGDPLYAEKLLTFVASLLAFFVVSLGAMNFYSPYMMAPPLIIWGVALGSCLSYSEGSRPTAPRDSSSGSQV